MVVLNSNSSFGDWSSKWKKQKFVGLSKGYITSLDSLVTHLNQYIGDMSVSDIKPADVSEVIGELAYNNPNTEKPASKQFLRTLRFVAIEIFEFIGENTNCDRNSAVKTKIPKNAPKKQRRALTETEIKWIIDMLHRSRVPALIMTFCGLRAGEMIPPERFEKENGENHSASIQTYFRNLALQLRCGHIDRSKAVRTLQCQYNSVYLHPSKRGKDRNFHYGIQQIHR